MREWRAAIERVVPSWWPRALAVALIVFGLILPQLFSSTSNFVNTEILALTYVMFALGLNIVVGFAGLLDLGYVAFFALGSYAFGWLGSGWFFKAHVHILVHGAQGTLPGIHLNFVLILICAGLFTAFAGAIIGVPTLRLRGDYIAIVTLAFGEIIRVFALQGTSLKIFGMPLTGGELGISGTDPPYLPGVGLFSRAQHQTLVLRDLRARPDHAVRQLARARLAAGAGVDRATRGRGRRGVDGHSAASRTKLSAYALGAAFGGVAGAFLGAYTTLIDAGEFQFGFSIFVLSMVILGGLGSIWGWSCGALLLANINYYLIPDVFNSLPGKLGLNFNLTDLQVSIFGFLLVIVMVLRPQGLIPERRRKLELTRGIGETEMEEPGTAWTAVEPGEVAP